MKVQAESTVKIPPRSEMEIMASLDKEVVQGTWLLEQSNSTDTSTVVARALVETSSGQVPVRLLNAGLKVDTIYAGMEIAVMEPVDTIMLDCSVNNVSTKKICTPEEVNRKEEVLRNV